ncbi:hypothetical protein ACGYK6_16415 [Sulfitobacter sp. 1A15333]|uniref:hypothetical protein n=1 Tax=Sulfitobacter sp. 1A15333 TaxID=3368570 RepID=UPI003744BF67
MTFSAQEMHRPIFETMGAEKWEDEEKDWWNREVTVGNESPLRHLRVPVGGKATKDLSTLAAEYHNAAEVLIHTIRAEPPSVLRCGNVLLYLYRHSIELLLKDIIPADLRRRDHEFSQLAARFKFIISEDFAGEVPDWIARRIMEFAEIDPRSTTFRYNEHEAFVSGPTYMIDIVHLRAAMNALNTALVGARAVMILEGKNSENG